MIDMDRADTSSDQWGVYENECSICHKKIVIVATVHSVDFGYSETDPRGDVLCSECGGEYDYVEVIDPV